MTIAENGKRVIINDYMILVFGKEDVYFPSQTFMNECDVVVQWNKERKCYIAEVVPVSETETSYEFQFKLKQTNSEYEVNTHPLGIYSQMIQDQSNYITFKIEDDIISFNPERI